MNKILCCVALLLVAATGWTQKIVVSGYVRDSITGESLLGANISITAEGRGTTTNAYGYFAIQAPKQQYQVVV
ncbi:MAG: hypothetical protein EAY68_08140, partial [Bacteroidetes bacterium]